MKEPRTLVVTDYPVCPATVDVLVVSAGTALYGMRLDRIVIEDTPQNPYTAEWINHLMCRLSPKGELVDHR